MKENLLNLTLVIFLGIFCSAVFHSANSKNPPKTYPKNYSRNLTKILSGKISVIDGDSIRVGGKEIRLLGLDAPEYRQTCFNNKNKKYFCGKISRVFLLKLANKKSAKCFYSKKDIYNRYLGECFINKISINNQILKSGMAVVYDFTQATNDEIKAEKFAQTNKLGIWQGSFQLPKDYRKANYRK